MFLGNLPPVLQDGGYRPRQRPRLPLLAHLRGRSPPFFEILREHVPCLISQPQRIGMHLTHDLLSEQLLALSMVEAMYSAASTVSPSHSAMARPVDMFPAFAKRWKTSNTSSVTGTETLGGFVGGKFFVHVQHFAALCSKTQYLLIRRAISPVRKFPKNAPRAAPCSARASGNRATNSPARDRTHDMTWGDAPYPITVIDQHDPSFKQWLIVVVPNDLLPNGCHVPCDRHEAP